ncbi:MAG: ABC transporter permease [Odoribacteraceae bacterium]|jgi:ABC-2 type transport system permease protein|nr:ABC transporter permease [Odoribacteraceae bacterium]
MNKRPFSTPSLFAAFARKEFYHIFRDRRTIMILLVMPVIQVILFGFAITTEVKHVKIGLLDPVPDVATRRVADRLLASDYFDLARVLHSPAGVERALRRGEIDMALVFEPRFQRRLLRDGPARVQLVVDATDPNTAALFTGHARQIIADAGRELAPPAGATSLAAETRLLHNPAMKAAYNFVPGVMGLILMLICAMMTSISIVREKETGTLEVLLVSPARPLLIIAAKIMPYLLLSCVNLATILLLSVHVLDVPVAGSLFWLVAISLLFIIVSLSIGIFVSTVTRSQVAAMLVSGMLLMMPVMLLSGLIFPVEGMPPFLRGLSCLIPARWYISAVKRLMIEGAPVTVIAREALALTCTGALLVALSIKNFKNRLS